MPNTCFQFENMKKKYSNKRKNLNQIENFSYEVVRFQGTVPVSITCLIACKTDCFCFFMVLIKLRIWQKDSAPFLLRKVPDTFCFIFVIRISRSAWLLSNGMSGCSKNARILSSYLTKRFHKFWAGVCFLFFFESEESNSFSFNMDW